MCNLTPSRMTHRTWGLPATRSFEVINDTQKDPEADDEDLGDDENPDAFMDKLRGLHEAKPVKELFSRKRLMSAGTPNKPAQVINLLSAIEEVHLFPQTEPEFLEVEMTPGH